MHFTLRRATACDADAIANVYSTSFRLLTFLPMLHTIEDYGWFISNWILKECEVTVAEDESGIVAFLALQGEEVRLLYTRPDRIGMGAGSQLIDAAKASGVGALELWCFQANTRARRFYEARGFRAIRLTDGADNEERTPDVRYRWEALTTSRSENAERGGGGSSRATQKPETAGTTICRIMEPAEFRAYHAPALELQEVKHGYVLNALARMGGEKLEEVSYWTLSEPGECAIQLGHRSLLLLGELAENQCRTLAELTAPMQYPGLIGPDMTAKWFTDRARELGLQFLEPEALQLYSISDKPKSPGASGRARPATISDTTLLADWLTAFHREAVPQYPVPARAELERAAGEDQFLFWIDKGKPVSMAGIARRLKTSAAIRAVYTPPELRGRRYAGSVTAAMVERIYAEGRKTACLYADLNNPASIRCYTKIGFTPVCTSLHFRRNL